MPGKSPRRKGDEGERELVALLKELGVPCFRKISSGSGWPHDLTNAGDIGLTAHPESKVEVKRRRSRFSLSDAYQALESADYLFVRQDRKDTWLVIEKLGLDCSFVRTQKEKEA